MATGTVKWLDDVRGFGFISSEDGGKDVFVHHIGIACDGPKSLFEGQAVEFDTQNTRRGSPGVERSHRLKPAIANRVC